MTVPWRMTRQPTSMTTAANAASPTTAAAAPDGGACAERASVMLTFRKVKSWSGVVHALWPERSDRRHPVTITLVPDRAPG